MIEDWGFALILIGLVLQAPLVWLAITGLFYVLGHRRIRKAAKEQGISAKGKLLKLWAVWALVMFHDIPLTYSLYVYHCHIEGLPEVLQDLDKKRIYYTKSRGIPCEDNPECPNKLQSGEADIVKTYMTIELEENGQWDGDGTGISYWINDRIWPLPDRLEAVEWEVIGASEENWRAEFVGGYTSPWRRFGTRYWLSHSLFDSGDVQNVESNFGTNYVGLRDFTLITAGPFRDGDFRYNHMKCTKTTTFE